MKSLIVLFLLLATHLAFCQSILKITEVDDAGKTHEFKSVKPIVDINSSLTIKLDKSRLLTRIGIKYNEQEGVDSLITRIDSLRKGEEAVAKSMEAYSQAYETFLADRSDEAREALLVADAKRADFSDEIRTSMSKSESFEEDFGKLLSEKMAEGDFSTTGQYQALVEAVLMDLERLDQQLEALLKDNVTISLAASRISNNQVVDLNIPGFDDNPEQDYYEVSRFKIALLPEDRQRLNELSAAYQDAVPEELFKNVTNSIPRFLRSKVQEKVGAIGQILDQLLVDLGSVALEEIQPVLQQVTLLRSSLNTLESLSKQEIQAETRLELIQQVDDNVLSLTEQIVGLSNAVKELLKKNLTSTVLAQLSKALNKIDLAKTSIKEVVTGDIREMIKGLISANNAALLKQKSLEISDKVYRLSLEDLPEEETRLDLKVSGVRKSGDNLLIRLVYFDAAKPEKAIPLETYEPVLMETLSRVHSTVAFVFAKPVDTNIYNSFKGGPGYSILLKFGSRNRVYKQFFDIGLGLQVASFDFNNDDVPELGGGIVVSLFKDYLQGGWGLNFNENMGYSFVGLRIPIPNGALFPANPQN
ncbi:MAG: hypothetical protein AAFR66_01050 [Bacteroidota bacterium]